MPKVAVYNVDGQQVGDIDLNDEVFGVEVNEPLMHQAVVRHLANQRQGTVATKTRGEVRGGGRKPWRQKGTGRARHGSIRSPIWVGGGVTFGPQPRDYRQKMPKKSRRAALRSALSGKVQAGEFVVVDAIEFAAPRTKEMVRLLGHFTSPGEKALVVTVDGDRNVVLSARNLPGVAAMRAADLNVYDVLAHGKLLVTKDAVRHIEEALAQ